VTQGAHVVSTFQISEPQSYFYYKHLEKNTILAQVDVKNFEVLHDLITKHQIEYIFHLAAQALVEVAYYNPKQTLETNILGTINVLESARLYPQVKAVIVASSDKAYGKLTGGKYKETDALRGDHPYDVSKSATDLITTTYATTYGVPAVVTRFGNIYGEGDLNFSRIIPGILESLISKKQLELRSNGSYVRDFLYVKDVVSGYLLLAKKIKQTKGKSFNFGTRDTLSVLELIHAIEKSLDQKVNYKIVNTSKNEIPYQSLNYAKVKLLGWKPESTVANSIRQIYNYYQTVFTKESK